jgi:Fe2+ or Zn2+ uptake regulation protein
MQTKPSLQSLYDRLRHKLPRLTKGKKAVVALLYESDVALTAQELFEHVQSGACRASLADTTLDLATIYRNLEQLERVHVVTKTEYCSGGWKYALVGAHHNHSIRCVECGKQVIMDECFLSDVDRLIEQKTGFTSIHHTVTFTGSCPACQKKHS